MITRRLTISFRIWNGQDILATKCIGQWIIKNRLQPIDGSKEYKFAYLFPSAIARSTPRIFTSYKRVKSQTIEAFSPLTVTKKPADEKER